MSTKKRKRADTDDVQNKRPKPNNAGGHKNSEGDSRGKQKQLKQERKSLRKNAEVVDQIKQWWETGRQKSLDSEKRKKLVGNIMDMINGKVKEIVFKHDAVRVVQFVVKYGSVEQRGQICEELKDCTVELCRNHYGRFLIIKIMKYCGKKVRDKVINDISGHVLKLVLHREAAEVVETIYAVYANGTQRNNMIMELYGPEWRLFKIERVSSIKELLVAHPGKKASISKNLAKVIDQMINKGVIRYSLPHRVILDYLTICGDAGRKNVIEGLRESIPEILHTREGSLVAIECISHATAKDRKVILKSFKNYVSKMCHEEFGHLVVQRVFDVVDDTGLVGKIVLGEMKAELLEIACHEYGHLAVLHLLAPRDPKYLSEWKCSVLPSLDVEGTVSNSKKDPAKRQDELVKSMTDELSQLCRESTYELLCDLYGSRVLLEVVANFEDERENIFAKILEAVAQQGDEDAENVLVHRIANRTLKKLAKTHSNFATALADQLAGSLASLADGFASGVVLTLVEHEATQDKVCAELLQEEGVIARLVASDNETTKKLGQFLTEKSGAKPKGKGKKKGKKSTKKK